MGRSYKHIITNDDGSTITHFVDGEVLWTDAEGYTHRDGGPALIASDINYWYQKGKRHREDGAAMEYRNGPKKNQRVWFIYEKNITEEVETWMEKNNISYPLDEHAILEFKLRWL